MPDLLTLTRTECEDLLRSGEVGRIALSTPSGPHVIPINYAVVDDAIVVRTSPYSLLGTYGRDSTLAFEVDQIGPGHHDGWSVVVRGRSEFVTDAVELDRIREVGPPEPAAGGAREMYLRLRWDEISGRRLRGTETEPTGLTHRGAG